MSFCHSFGGFEDSFALAASSASILLLKVSPFTVTVRLDKRAQQTAIIWEIHFEHRIQTNALEIGRQTQGTNGCRRVQTYRPWSDLPQVHLRHLRQTARQGEEHGLRTIL